MDIKGRDAKLKARGRKLLDCINTKDFESITKLLQEGVDFGVTDRGDAAIHLAARNGYKEIIKLLLDHGDDITRENEYGNFAIHYAARNGHMSTVEYLIEKGSIVNAENLAGDTPLHSAVMYQPMDFIEKLVELGMKVNIQNTKGETPLHLAVAHNRREAMEALLICRANPDIKDKDGNKPVDMAKTTAIAEQLQICGDLMAAMESGYIQAEGKAVDPKQTFVQLKRVGVTIAVMKTNEFLPYQLYCRREKTENSEVKVPTKKSEEVLSDIFHFRAPEAVDVIQFEAKIPLYSELGLREQGEVRFVDGKTKKIDDGKTKKIEKTFKEDEQVFCSVRLAIQPGSSEVFTLIAMPRVEERSISTKGTTIQSKVEEKFQLKVPPGSFEEDTKVSLKVYDSVECEKPATKRLKAEKRQLLTDVYEIQITGKQPTKKIKIEFPLSSSTTEADTSDESDIVIVRADENNLVDESSLVTLPGTPTKTGDTLSFYVDHFSIHVAVSLRMITGNPRSVFDQICSSRDRKRPAIFFVMIQEQGMNQNIAVVECVLAELGTDRIQYWKDKGYVRQDLGESGSFLFEPGQDFKINFLGNVVATGTKSLRKLTFVPKRPSYQPYRLGIEDRNKPPMGEVTIYSVRHEDSTPAEGSGDVVDVTAKLPFKVPVPPKPVEGLGWEETEGLVPVLTETMRIRLRRERRENREKKESSYKYKAKPEENEQYKEKSGMEAKVYRSERRDSKKEKSSLKSERRDSKR